MKGHLAIMCAYWTCNNNKPHEMESSFESECPASDRVARTVSSHDEDRIQYAN